MTQHQAATAGSRPGWESTECAHSRPLTAECIRCGARRSGVSDGSVLWRPAPVPGSLSGMDAAVRRVQGWLRDLGIDEYVTLQPPEVSWQIPRLHLHGPAGTCSLTLWNEDGEIRALFDHKAEVRFDDDDEDEWDLLHRHLVALADGELTVERPVPFLPWKVKLNRGRRSTADTQRRWRTGRRSFRSYR